MAADWKTLTRRTDDPKLSWLEDRLKAHGIPSRRNGHSFHAPILEVPAEHTEAAWTILDAVVEMDDGTTIPLDDIPDDHAMFRERH